MLTFYSYFQYENSKFYSNWIEYKLAPAFFTHIDACVFAGKSMDPQHDIQNAVSNIICSIVFGERFDYDNKRFSYLLKILNNHFMLTGSAAGQVWSNYSFYYFILFYVFFIHLFVIDHGHPVWK